VTSGWRPRETTPEEDARALAIAVAAGTVVGATAFWLARTLLGRDVVRIAPPELPLGSDRRPPALERPGRSNRERAGP